MIPIAFVTDHIETLYELQVELVENMEEVGFIFENYVVMNGINEHPSYIKALAEEALLRLSDVINEGDKETKTEEAKVKVSTV